MPLTWFGSLLFMVEPAIAQDISVEDEGNRLFQAGVELRQDGDYDAALEKFQAALRWYENANNYQRQADTLNQMGNVYLSLGQHEQAADFYQQALAARQADARAPLNAVPAAPRASSPTSSFIQFPPPDVSTLGQRRPGGTRGGSAFDSSTLIALVPDTYGEYTRSPYPNLFVSLPNMAVQDNAPIIVFRLFDEQNHLIHESARVYPNTAGILSIRLDEITNLPPLAINQSYQWDLFVVEPGIQVPFDSVSGRIQRLESSATEEHAARDMNEVIGYDAIAALLNLRQQDPDDAAIEARLHDLLPSVASHEIDTARFIGDWSDLNSLDAGFHESLNSEPDDPQEFEPEALSDETEAQSPERRRRGSGGGGGGGRYAPPSGIAPAGRSRPGGPR
jgi:hypothetical protein